MKLFFNIFFYLDFYFWKDELKNIILNPKKYEKIIYYQDEDILVFIFINIYINIKYFLLCSDIL